MSSESRQGAYKLAGQVFHGIALGELMCCCMLLFRKFSSDPNVIKTPIFLCAMVAIFWCLVTLSMYSIALVLLTKKMDDGDPYWPLYYAVTLPVECFGTISCVFSHAMILIRLKAFSGIRSIQFGVMAFLSFAHICTGAASGYLGIKVRLFMANFWLGPQYKTWIFLAGLTVMIDAVLNLASAYLFLSHICSALNMKPIQMAKNVFLQHEGPRWVALLCNTLLGVNQTHITVVYHMTPFQYLLAIYCFLESSYVAARAIIESHSIATKQLHMTTVGTTNQSKTVSRGNLDASQSASDRI
ncbi:hypothetical protein EDD86DRAFT_247171 [Gorgonomyces haynaldii]|nr:hypothetical protein EDD86DRAFT_247171 [Gorgonomyces haynaldii]